MDPSLVENILLRLEAMDRKLELLLNERQVDPLAQLPQETVDLKQEIAAVKLAGGDLVSHFKQKARASCRTRA